MTLTGVTQSKIGDVYWRASEASETVLGVDNAKSGIYYMYIILIARVRVQYGKIFYKHAKYFHEPKASENVA